MSKETVRVALLTGYLGAGKTTTLNYILNNQEGIRAAVIVNDIGEVNIDAELIEKNGGATMEDENLIPLSNGCICCTLADDLAAQLGSLARSGKYNYIIIEASGICEPAPIAQTIAMICDQMTEEGVSMKIDNIIAVVDAARMLQEFENGRALQRKDLEEDDLENLLIQQIEFCTTIILNKTDLVNEDELNELKAIVRSLQSDAKIIETVNGQLPVSEALNTDIFNLDRAMASAGWVDAIQHPEKHDHHEEHEHHDHDHEEHEHHDHDHEEHDHHDHDHEEHEHHDHDHEEHDHHHHHGHGHHHHHHGPGEMYEYGIDTFVYHRRRPFVHDKLVELCDAWPHSIIRCKGMVWYQEEPSMSFIFEQAGRQIIESPSGKFLASAPKAQQEAILNRYPQVKKMWDEKYGDRMIKLVFIGKNMDREGIEAMLDSCLGE